MEENMQHSQDRRMRPPESGQYIHHQPPPLEKCPRCDSANTKFCYYNNYSLSQPRYFCKSCRRYWTHGGTLRNVPVGGGCRKSKRPKISGPASSTEVARTPVLPSPAHPGQDFLTGIESSICSNSLYGSGALLSSLATLQAINQPLFAVAGGSSGGGFGTNMALLQGMNGSSFRPQVAQQQYENALFPSQHDSMSSFNQVLVNRGSATTSAMVEGNLWSGITRGEGDNHACSSFNTNQSSGIDPPQ